jgi:hypothetical protein
MSTPSQCPLNDLQINGVSMTQIKKDINEWHKEIYAHSDIPLQSSTSNSQLPPN